LIQGPSGFTNHRLKKIAAPPQLHGEGFGSLDAGTAHYLCETPEQNRSAISPGKESDLVADDCAGASRHQHLPQRHLTLRDKRTDDKEQERSRAGKACAEDDKNAEECGRSVKGEQRQELVGHGLSVIVRWRIGRPRMDDCVLQDGPHRAQRAVLRLGDDTQRPLVWRLVRQSNGLIEDVGRNMIGMRDKADIHPTLDRLVAIIIPIDRAAYHAESVEARESLRPAQTQRRQANVATEMP
jgi:hypothetical protein